MTETLSCREIGVNREGYVATIEMRWPLHNCREMSQRCFWCRARAGYTITVVRHNPALGVMVWRVR